MPHYQNAPIMEAIIDVRVDMPIDAEGMSIPARLGSFRPLVRGEYPRMQPLGQLTSTFSTGEHVELSAKQTRTGSRFYSQDGKQLFQPQINGFTFSRLRPYVDWDSFRAEAARMWTIYKDVLNPARISRVAVRYVNQIDIPPQTDLKDFFRTSPEISSDLPQILSAYTMSLQIPEEDWDGTIILHQEFSLNPPPARVGVILDIDVFKEDPNFASDEEMWTLFEFLRSRKNAYFEGCITDKTRALIS